MTGKEKTKFRSTKLWKCFRQSILDERGAVCECCGRRLPENKLQLHHLKPNEYENLNPNNFVLLCSYCHDNVERISKMKAETRQQLNKNYLAVYEKYLSTK